MTGWQREPVAMMPKPVCRGGQVVSVAAGPGAGKYSCACPQGRTAQALSDYQNTFQCIPDVVAPPPAPKIACIDGVVRGGKCTCGAGKTAKLAQYAISGNAPAYRCEDEVRTKAAKPTRVSPQPQIVCSGGSVRADRCACQPGFAPVKTGTTSFRCQRVEILPPVTRPKSVAPTRTRAPIRVAPRPSAPTPRRVAPRRVP